MAVWKITCKTTTRGRNKPAERVLYLPANTLEQAAKSARQKLNDEGAGCFAITSIQPETATTTRS